MLSQLLYLLTLLALLSTTVLYTYPLVFRCSFPSPSPAEPAPFRLLALGDPQLEGSTSLPPFPFSSPSVSDGSTESSLFRFITEAARLKIVLSNDVPILLQLLRKRLDLWGNDYYLGHIYTCLRSWLSPSHVVVLGDLLGSQWIGEEEFEKRGKRYWGRVFKDGERVDVGPGEVMATAPLVQDEADIGEEEEGKQAAWPSNRIINVVGNHDIGYAGDVDVAAIERWEKVFGPVNYGMRMPLRRSYDRQQGDEESAEEKPIRPDLRVVNLNSLNLDVPVLESSLQDQSYNFINNMISTFNPNTADRTSALVLLTHLPLHKEPGICVDGPAISYYQHERNDGIREQNHLSQASSAMILESLFGFRRHTSGEDDGRGRNGIILTGHDHEGCDVWHYLADGEEGGEKVWKAKRWNETTEKERVDGVGIREVTVRSMMGEFGGNAALLGAWFEENKESWTFEINNCALGKQHWWWAVHVADLVTIGLWIGFGALKLWRGRRTQDGRGKQKVS